MSLRVDVLHSSDCAQSARVVEVVEREARRLGVTIDLNVQCIVSARAASELGMRGSPTVLIGGEDILATQGALPPIGFT